MLFVINLLMFFVFQEYQLKLTISVPREEGTVFIAVYHEDDEFMSDASIELTKEVTSSSVEIDIPINKKGKYAIAVFQDLNSDEKLSTSFVGIPNEPYGFSNNARGSFGPPNFTEASFNISGNTAHSIILQ